MKQWFIGLALLITASTGLAQGYAAVDLAHVAITPGNQSRDADTWALQFLFGSYFTPEGTFAGEFRLGMGIKDDKLGGAKFETDRYFGGYLRAQFPKRFPLRPYAMLGVTRVETTQSGRGEDYNDLSIGFGAELTLNNSLFARMEYLAAANRSKGDVDNLSFGIGARF